MSAPILRILSIADRPDLIPLVARWRWEAFGRGQGRPLEASIARVAAAVTDAPMPRTLVLLADGAPVGTASLTAEDLEERPDLSPWLASVVVEETARGQGFAAVLVGAIEAEARAQGVATLWLYTDTAERIYARIGWRTVEHVPHGGGFVVLMRRDLTEPALV